MGIDAHRRRRDMSPKAAQGIANGLMIAALALLTILGVPRSDIALIGRTENDEYSAIQR
jgi:hypothetical protein